MSSKYSVVGKTVRGPPAVYASPLGRAWVTFTATNSFGTMPTKHHRRQLCGPAYHSCAITPDNLLATPPAVMRAPSCRWLSLLP